MAVSEDAERGAVNAADGGSHDREECIQPEKQARVDAESLGSSQPAGTEILSQPAEEAASTSSAGFENIISVEVPRLWAG